MKSAIYTRRIKNSREIVGVSTVTFGSKNEPTPHKAFTPAGQKIDDRTGVAIRLWRKQQEYAAAGNDFAAIRGELWHLNSSTGRKSEPLINLNRGVQILYCNPDS